MHSGYGEMQQQQQQQFMVDGCPPSSFFSISPPPPATSSIQNQQKFYHLPTHQPQHHHHHQPLPPPPQFSHLIHPVPITQQLFHPHPFQLFHHHHSQLGMEHKPTLDNSSSPAPAPGPSSFLDSLMSFKLGADDASPAAAAGSGDHVLNEDDVHVLHGDDGPDGSRLHSWRREEEPAATIKQPFWRPLDIDYINRNNKRPKSPENNTTTTSSGANCSKKSREAAVFLDPNQANTATAVADSNYKLFSELEAIYKPGNSDGGALNNNQTGSGSCSALTGDDNHPIHAPAGPAICPVAINTDQFYHGSDASDGGDAMPPPSSTNKSQKASSRRKQRAKQRQQEQTAAITAFFESLMKQVMDHQESLHCKFLHVMEKRDQERASREEASRKEEAARSAREAASRAQERALAASREAAIVSFLEKITGESLELPVAESHKEDQECNAMELYNADCGNNNSTSAAAVQLSNNRWPKTEVQALIRVRSGLDPRFQEPGLKGPLWEEVSSTMEAMGYRRSAKRCKEKWENINKYFRKTKDSGKRRSQRSKTCPYFQQLDQLYSKSGSVPPSSSIAGVKNEESRNDNNNKNNSELLDAIVLVSNDQQSFKFPEMGSDQVDEVGSSAMAGKARGNYGDEDDNEDQREGELEGEGDSQQEQEQEHENQLHFREGGEDLQLHDSTFYFQRLRC